MSFSKPTSGSRSVIPEKSNAPKMRRTYGVSSGPRSAVVSWCSIAGGTSCISCWHDGVAWILTPGARSWLP